MSLSLNALKEKEFLKYILPATFDNLTVSSNVSFVYINAFEKEIGFDKLLLTTLTFKKAPNSTFQTSEVIGYM